MEGPHNAEKYWRTANSLEYLEQTFSAYEVKSLSEVKESQVERLSLLSALLL